MRWHEHDGDGYDGEDFRKFGMIDTSNRKSNMTITALKPSPAPAKVSRLGAVKKGRLKVAHAYLFYGSEGVGKSSLAADAPSPIFIDVEGGTDSLDVDRYTFRDELRGHVPRTFGEVMTAIDELVTVDHDYKTLVIDTIDALEALIHRDVCQAESVPELSAIPYGRGPKIAIASVRMLLAKLEQLKTKGVSIVLLGHSVVRPMRNPTGDPYDRYQLRVDKDAGEQLKSWVDVVGFVRFEDGVNKAGKHARAIGWTTGQRLISLKHEAAWDGKSRLTLADEIPLSSENPWEPFGLALAEADNESESDIRASITAELARIGDTVIKADGSEIASAVVASACTSATRAQLMRTLQMLRNQTPKEEKQ